VEAGIFAWDLCGEPTERAQHEASSLIKIYKHLVSDAVAQQPIRMNPQKHEEATFKAQEMKIKQEDAENATLGQTFIRETDKANAFSKLSRCETAIEQSFYKALHGLQRLQANRRAESNAPPPVAVDVSVVSRKDLRKWLCFVKKELSTSLGNRAPFLAGSTVIKDRVGLSVV
jgi:hypothetical protein